MSTARVSTFALIAIMTACSSRPATPRPSPVANKPQADESITGRSVITDEHQPLIELYPKGEWTTKKTIGLAAESNDPHYLWLTRNQYGECYLECYGFGATRQESIYNAERTTRTFLDNYRKFAVADER